MIDRRLFLVGASSLVSTEAMARGCWRPNGWCRRAQRRRESEQRAADQKARQERLASMTAEERAEFIENEKRERERRYTEYLQREAKRQAEIAEREKVEKLDRDRSAKFWKDIGFFIGIPLIGAAFIIVGTKIFGVDNGSA